MTDFFHLAECFQGSSVLEHVSVFHPLLWPNNIHARTYILIMLSLIDGHLDNFHFLAIMNDAAINIHEQVPYGHMFSFLLGVCTGVKLVGYMATLCLTVRRISRLLSKRAVSFYIPTSSPLVFPFLHSLTSS